TANNDSYSTNEDIQLEIAAPGVLTNDIAAEGNSLTAVFDSSASHGELFVNSDGSFIYKPDSDFVGNDTFTYHANNGTTNSNVATVTITVNSVNDKPTANDASFTTQEETSLSNSLSGTDPEGDQLTFAKATDPSNGSVILNADGTFTYTPNENYSGSDSFTFTVSDGGDSSDPATVTILVTNTADVPEFVSEPLTSILQDEEYVYNIVTNDSDGDSLTITSTSLPSWLDFTDNGDNTARLNGTATNNEIGEFDVVLQVTDGENVASQSFTIMVENVNDAPTFTSSPITTATQDAVYTYQITTKDLDGDLVTITATELPAWLELIDNEDGTATLSGTPSFEEVGEHLVSISVTDVDELQDIQNFTITITGALELIEIAIADLENLDPSEIKNLGSMVSKVAQLLQLLSDADKETHAAFIEKFHEYKAAVKDKVGIGQGKADPRAEELDKIGNNLWAQSSKLYKEHETDVKIKEANEIIKLRKDLQKTRTEIVRLTYLVSDHPDRETNIEKLQEQKLAIYKKILAQELILNGEELTPEKLQSIENKINDNKGKSNDNNGDDKSKGKSSDKSSNSSKGKSSDKSNNGNKGGNGKSKK
ncbi:MAG: Ig-like domain-containing protein, partial [Thaumarchaeota archaeon]|nr:Ig-like domain-containing protein [Nitrososphaerota archaeon]